MRGGLLLAGAAIAAGAVIAGCGQQASPGSAPTGATSPATSPAVSPAASGPANPAACIRRKPRSGTITISSTDNGKTFCVRKGTRIFVFLRGTLARRWTPITPNSGNVVPRPSGVLSLMVGETGGFFQAVRSGVAELTSIRSPCHPSAGSSPGVGCTAKTVFRVTLLISR